jgi:peptidase A4-like protein
LIQINAAKRQPLTKFWRIGPRLRQAPILPSGEDAMNLRMLTVALLLLPGAAHAQLSAGPVYDVAHTVATGIRGVTTFPPAPAGFDAVRASDQRLAMYGLPPRPPRRDAEATARWAAAMAIPARKATEGPWVTPWRAGPAKLNAPARLTGEASRGPIAPFASYNWSGYADRNMQVSAWNSTYSFAQVAGEFNVPVAQQAFASGGGNLCDGGWDMVVSWAGIDGIGSDDVLSGGGLSGAFCSPGTTQTIYCAWTEWYPTNSNIMCEFSVSPGDDIYVEVWDTSSTQGYVYLLDKTTQTYQTVSLMLGAGLRALVGSSAEWMVSRPFGSNGLPTPLANYVANWWSGAGAWSFARLNNGKPLWQGPGIPSAVNFYMTNDAQTMTISTAVAAGRTGIVFQNANCAQIGGC